jgi:hypothetical protein
MNSRHASLAIKTMPRYTDRQIRELCAQVVKAQSEEELERAVQELRLAIKEHVRLAKDSLGVWKKLIMRHDRRNAGKREDASPPL